ncbi:MAG: hypothetical protein WC889_20420 [Myxococcota bacterium]|jgi:hypothetical protein
MIGIIKIRRGFNPNSSSLSVDMSVLLAVSTALAVIPLITAAVTRLIMGNRGSREPRQ